MYTFVLLVKGSPLEALLAVQRRGLEPKPGTMRVNPRDLVLEARGERAAVWKWMMEEPPLTSTGYPPGTLLRYTELD